MGTSVFDAELLNAQTQTPTPFSQLRHARFLLNCPFTIR